MLGPDSETDQASGDPCQKRKSRQEPDRKWHRKPFRSAKHTPDDAILNEELRALRHTSRPFAPILHPAQVLSFEPTGGQRTGQQIGGGNRILYC